MITIIVKSIWFTFVVIKAQLYENNTRTLNSNNITDASRRTHQITTILDRLLKNYDPHIRPNFGGKMKRNLLVFPVYSLAFKILEGPTKMKCDILVSSFGPIQDKDMVCILERTILPCFVC